MKKVLLLFLVVTLALKTIYTQENQRNQMLLIGDRVPSFTAESTMGSINFPDDYYAKWKIIFSHPADFTPVCSSEILELAHIQRDFEELKAVILVISTDRINSHLEWVKSLEAIDFKDYGKAKINFPLISDPLLEISQKFGMIHPGSNSTKSVRAVFFINPENKVSAILYYPNNLGRNTMEIKRVLVGLQTSESQNVLIPANWYDGDDVLLNSPKTINDSENLKKQNDTSLYSLEWYMWYKKIKN